MWRLSSFVCRREERERETDREERRRDENE